MIRTSIGEAEVILFTSDSSTSAEEDNFDVEIKLVDQRRYGATFFSLAGLERLMRLYKDTGECAGGTYFWCADMVVLGDLTLPTVERAIADLLKTGEIFEAFSRLEPPDLEQDQYAQPGVLDRLHRDHS